jgi:CheY-like chemotaxis protein
MKASPPLILVVEDQPLVRMAIEQGLQDSGYEVVAASNGADATGTMEAMGDTIGALVTNVHLGKGPDGWDVARRGRDLDPAIPVVYTTAGWASEWSLQAVPDSVVIPKPFRVDQIVTALATLIDEAARPRRQPRPGRHW